MSVQQQFLKSSDIYWLGGALFLSLLPLLSQLPWWMLILAGGIFIWRVQINRNKLAPPNKMLKMSVVLISVLLLAVSIQSAFSLQSFVSLLTLTASLKIIELNKKRDYLLLVFLGCFISASQLLFENSMLAFSYALVCFFVLHLCLLQANLNQRFSNSFTLKKLNKLAVMFLQAIPIAIVLFIVIPRIGSLWKVPLNTNVAKTGVSDSLTLGDIGNLNQDYSVAMRVTFNRNENERPANTQLYWRGVILSYFDGTTWHQQVADKNDQKQTQILLSTTQQNQLDLFVKQNTNKKYSYQVMLEASGRPWLYALNTGVVAGQSKYENLLQAQDYSISRVTPVVERFGYKLDSYPDYLDATKLSPQAYKAYTQLPNSQNLINNGQISNSKSRVFAQQLRAEHSTPEQLIRALMARFNTDYTYTLSPGKLDSLNAIDDFLFNTQRGYCEHFASSTAFVLRAAGIPARIVAGYQGGQWSSGDSYLMVTQADAHAWVEVWLKGKGWVRLDPTTAVAPERVDRGAFALLEQLDENLGLASQFNQFSLIRKLRLSWDNVNYQWHRWVIGYDNQLQLSFVKKLLGTVNAWRIGLLILFALAIVFLPWLIFTYWSRDRIKHDPLIICLKKLDKKLAKLNLYRGKGETVSAFLARAALLSNTNKNTFGQIRKTLNIYLYFASNNTSDTKQLNTRLGTSQVTGELNALIKAIKVN